MLCINVLGACSVLRCRSILVRSVATRRAALQLDVLRCNVFYHGCNVFYHGCNVSYYACRLQRVSLAMLHAGAHWNDRPGRTVLAAKFSVQPIELRPMGNILPKNQPDSHVTRSDFALDAYLCKQRCVGISLQAALRCVGRAP